eukprot:scaffold162186_cov63-Attheya_sp.AAC.2
MASGEKRMSEIKRRESLLSHSYHVLHTGLLLQTATNLQYLSRFYLATVYLSLSPEECQCVEQEDMSNVKVNSTS